MKEDNPSKLPPVRVRLDLFLKWSGLIRRRTLAQWMCERHAIRVNNQFAKAGRPVAAGDRIAIFRGQRVLKVEILALPTRMSTAREASAEYPQTTACYRILSEENGTQRENFTTGS